ncbi:MAG: polyketide synthase dehydratase domain-containing protein, partial [Desulfamplus sp.]|nr:polyketide synthase dehydratase domain-containing protein [Desulfamplus sp.]
NESRPINGSSISNTCTITSQFINSSGVAMGEPKLHYQAEVIVSNEKQSLAKRIEPGTLLPDTSSIGIGEKDTSLIYHPQRLFMDGVFKTIHDIISFDGKKLITKIADRSRAAIFADDPCPEFVTDVVLLDGMFQTGGVFEFLTDSFVVLPYKIKSLKFFKRGVKDVDYICITTRVSSDDETDTFDIDLVDSDGNYLMELVEFQMVKLNRLPDDERIKEMVVF